MSSTPVGNPALCFFFFCHDNNPKAPQNEKQKTIKPLSLDRQDKQRHMTTMSLGNKKITRKMPATNSKVLVHTGSLHFFKKYQQPIIKLWYRYRYARQFVNIYSILLASTTENVLTKLRSRIFRKHIKQLSKKQKHQMKKFKNVYSYLGQDNRKEL